jgi:hypothetical protein
VASSSSDPPKITIPSQQALHQSLVELYQRIAEHHDQLTKQADFDVSQRQMLSQNLTLCRKSCQQIEQICQQITRLPQAEYCERIDAYQQAVANDMVVQQKRLQSRLQHERHAVQAESMAVTRRFRNEKNQPLLWLFPTQSWQSVVQHGQSQVAVIDDFVARKADWKVPPKEFVSQWGGFPLLVLVDHAWTQKQLPPLLAVMAMVFLLAMTLTSRSVTVGAMTMLTLAYTVVVYGLAVWGTGLGFGSATLLPLAFVPLFLPVFLGVFRCHKNDDFRAYFQNNFSAAVICMGAGIVIAGHLLLSDNPALFAMGRGMVLAWASFMLSLLFNLAGLPGRQMPEIIYKTPETARQTAETVVDNKLPIPTQIQPRQSESHVPYQAVHEPVSTVLPATVEPHTETKPLSQATRDQLDFYRERIEATRIFDSNKTATQQTPPPIVQTPVVQEQAQTTQASIAQEQTQTVQENIVSAPSVLADFLRETDAPSLVFDTQRSLESLEQPEYPSVWSVGAKRRPMQSIVIEQADETRETNNETAFSRVSRHVTTKGTQLILKAQRPQISPQETPTILPLRQHGDHILSDGETNIPAAPRRKFAQ